MEPALNGREEELGPGHHGDREPAAMEPALNGREELACRI